MKKERYKEQVSAARNSILEKQHTGWPVVFTDGSAKQVRGYWQAGLGFFYGAGDTRNVSEHVPLGERQTVSRAELRGVLRALTDKPPCKPLHIVLDFEYIYKGLVEWAERWESNGCIGSMGPVGHRDLWESTLVCN